MRLANKRHNKLGKQTKLRQITRRRTKNMEEVIDILVAYGFEKAKLVSQSEDQVF